MNAFYCDIGDFLAWDENLMNFGYHEMGASGVYFIIAHEWGHTIQARTSRQAVSVARELQADCFAGAALAGSAQARLLALPPEAGTQLEKTLTSAADRYPVVCPVANSPWAFGVVRRASCGWPPRPE